MYLKGCNSGTIYIPTPVKGPSKQPVTPRWQEGCWQVLAGEEFLGWRLGWKRLLAWSGCGLVKRGLVADEWVTLQYVYIYVYIIYIYIHYVKYNIYLWLYRICSCFFKLHFGWRKMTVCMISLESKRRIPSVRGVSKPSRHKTNLYCNDIK